MNGSKFWKIIEHVHAQAGDDMNKKCEVIKKEMAKLSKAEALAFSRLFDTMMDRAYTWQLWGAAYIINGGCSDDTFSDFRASLISRGAHAFEKAIADPDSLAEEVFDEQAWFHEGYEYSIFDGLKSILGDVPEREMPCQQEPYGDAWTWESIDSRYPKLAKKFPSACSTTMPGVLSSQLQAED
jgi:hypothetical protein